MASERLMDLYKLQTEEVRFQVQLTWDRAKSSLTFHTALLALVAGFETRFSRQLTVGMLFFVSLSSLLCAGMIQVSHGYYCRARDQRKLIEQELDIEFGFVTTPGMGGEQRPRLERNWPRVTSILISIHFLISILAFSGAIHKWTH